MEKYWAEGPQGKEDLSMAWARTISRLLKALDTILLKVLFNQRLQLKHRIFLQHKDAHPTPTLTKSHNILVPESSLFPNY